MKDYYVQLPVSGIIGVSVQAVSEDDAIEKALVSNLTIENLEEWDVHEKIVEGNVCHALLWEAEADEE